MSKKNVIMDSQLLTTLMSCARLADFRFNLNLVSKGGKSNSLEVGSLAHFIKEHFNRAKLKGINRNDAILIGYEAGMEYVKGFHPLNKYQLDKEEKGLVNTPKDSQKIGKRNVIGWSYVFDTMAQYFDYYKNDSYTLINAEHVRGDVIYEDDDIRILWKAKFDEIYDMPNGFTSWDTKTMSQRRETVSLNNQFIGQCVLLRSRNVLIDKIGWQTSLKVEEKFERAVISYSSDIMTEWTTEIVPFWANMWVAFSEANNYPANYTYCENKFGKCPFYEEVCKADRNIRDEALLLHFEERKKWDVLNE